VIAAKLELGAPRFLLRCSYKKSVSSTDIMLENRTSQNRAMSDIFISYAREDRPKAKQLAEVLETQGWAVWWDIAIPAGKKFGEVIAEKLSQADAIVVLWSAISVKKDWVLDEALVGKKRGVLIPVFIEPTDPPLGFGQIHAANLVGWDGSSSAMVFIKFVKDISAVIGPPPISQASAKNNKKEPVQKVTDPERVIQKTPSLATDTPIEIKNLQRIFNLSKNLRIIVLALFMAAMLVAGLVFLVNRLNISSEVQSPVAVSQGNSSQKDINDDYVKGMRLFEAYKHAQAYPYFLKAAEQGNAYAQFYLGVMYENGFGAKLNRNEAIKWYRKSAEQGDTSAQINLASMYEHGRGVTRNDDEAVSWYRKAAQQGNTRAQDILARKGLSW
jgi:hypothetical protein